MIIQSSIRKNSCLSNETTTLTEAKPVRLSVTLSKIDPDHEADERDGESDVGHKILGNGNVD